MANNGEDSSCMGRRKCVPQVCRHWLVLIAGLLWLSVGIGLVIVACRWLSQIDWVPGIILAIFSIVAGLLIYVYGFSGIVRKNLIRIAGHPEKACFFAFQGWRSYFLILLMVVLGYTVRHLPIPRYIDAVIYFSMGCALAFASSLYFQEFFHI